MKQIIIFIAVLMILTVGFGVAQETITNADNKSNETNKSIKDVIIHKINETYQNTSINVSGTADKVSDKTGLSKTTVIMIAVFVLISVLLTIIWKIVKFAIKIGLIIALIFIGIWLIKRLLF